MKCWGCVVGAVLLLGLSGCEDKSKKCMEACGTAHAKSFVECEALTTDDEKDKCEKRIDEVHDACETACKKK